MTYADYCYQILEPCGIVLGRQQYTLCDTK